MGNAFWKASIVSHVDPKRVRLTGKAFMGEGNLIVWGPSHRCPGGKKTWHRISEWYDPTKDRRWRFSCHAAKFKYCFASHKKCPGSGRGRQQAFAPCMNVDVGVERRAEGRVFLFQKMSWNLCLKWWKCAGLKRNEGLSACSELSCSFGLSRGVVYLCHSHSMVTASLTAWVPLVPSPEASLVSQKHQPPFWELCPLRRDIHQGWVPLVLWIHFHISRDHLGVQKYFTVA